MKNILVVEDNLVLQKLIIKKISQKGLTVFAANSVKGAMEQLSENEINAVWLDHYLLGNEDGLDLVVAMKEEGSKQDKIPIFVISNSADFDKTNAYMRLGVEKYYVKSSVSLNDIVNEIDEYLNGEEK